MAQPCTTDGFGDCSDCGPQSPCCTLDVSGVTIIWSGCGGPVPTICGWVPDASEPTGFRSQCWSAPGKTFTKFTYVIENTECDFVTDPGVMERWQIANWPMGQTRTFERTNATNLRTCAGIECLPAGGHPANTTFPLHAEGDSGGGPNGYLADGTPVNPLNPCRNLPITGLGTRPPSGPTIFFDAPNIIRVLHPCRITVDGADTLEHATVTITAEEYTPAIHEGIVNDELLNTPFPAYAMMRTRSRTVPGVVDDTVVQYVAWPPDHIHCDFPSPFATGSDPTRPNKVLIRVSDPGLCNPSQGNVGPVTDLEIRKMYGQAGNIYVADCFNCGQRPSNILPPP